MANLLMMNRTTRIINTFCKKPVRYGAEVGVWRGQMTEWWLQQFPELFMFCVDPWDATIDRTMHRRQSTHNRWYAHTLERLKPYSERCEIMRMSSVDGAVDPRIQPLDFVFIDANHDFNGVWEDLSEWWPHVKPEGVIICHDYHEKRFPRVTEAFDEFCKSKRIKQPTPDRAKLAYTVKF